MQSLPATTMRSRFLPQDKSEQTPQPSAYPASGNAATGNAQPGALRVIDANANRAAEGLRVVEEYLRFILEDVALCESAKRVRHQLAGLLAHQAFDRCWMHRDSNHDIGATITASGEQIRADSAAVARASLKRVEQALRCLEEYSKTLAADAALGFEALRYTVYQLERQILQLLDSQARLSTCSLYVLVDGGESETVFLSKLDAIISAGADAIQLRDKRLGDRELMGRAELLRDRTRGRCLFIMNDRIDLAIASEADGVHLGQDELLVGTARRLLGAEKLIGVSTHDSAQVRQAVDDGATYLGCGPTFPSTTKSFQSFPGPPFLQQVAAATSLPFFAIGGISEANLQSLIEIGVSRIAVGSAVWNAPSPADALHRLRAILEGSLAEQRVEMNGPAEID